MRMMASPRSKAAAKFELKPMHALRRTLAVAVIALVSFGEIDARAAAKPPQEVLRNWYQLILELVRHTPTYSPPVASRAFAYVGLIAFEAVATGAEEMNSL